VPAPLTPSPPASALSGTGSGGIEKAKALLSQRPKGSVPTPDYSKGLQYIAFVDAQYKIFTSSLNILSHLRSEISSGITDFKARKTMLEHAVCSAAIGILASLPTGGVPGVPAGSVNWLETPLGWQLQCIYSKAREEMTRKD
jgi:hypothetical protein